MCVREGDVPPPMYDNWARNDGSLVYDPNCYKTDCNYRLTSNYQSAFQVFNNITDKREVRRVSKWQLENQIVQKFEYHTFFAEN